MYTESQIDNVNPSRYEGQVTPFTQREEEPIDTTRRRGRAAGINPAGRYESVSRHQMDDGWEIGGTLEAFKTTVQTERAKSIITENDSPDLSFDRSINPYRGCEHGCIYCFARPAHGFMGLSSGLDFETRLFAKPDAAKLLTRELARPGYRPSTIAIGTNTDPYQPVEKQWRIMRAILEVLDSHSHPVTIVTKSALICRDIDLLSSMAKRDLVRVALSLTSLDKKLARTMEPRAATPSRRLETMRSLSKAGIPVAVMVAPVIPGLNDHEIERLLDSAHTAGATQAGFILLRLPHDVREIFREWLQRHYPERFGHVMALLRSMRNGKDYDAEFGTRMRGTGPYAWQIGRRFEIAAKRLRLNLDRKPLRTDLFCADIHHGRQLSLL